MSKDSILWFSCISTFVRSFARLVALVTLKRLFHEMYWSNILVKYLADLYAGAVLLLIAGRIGISVLCNFSWALRVGGEAFFCVKNFICFLSIIRLPFCIVLCIKLWNSLVGSLVNMLKLLAVRKEWTFSEYSFELIIAIVLPLSAYVIIAFSVVNLLFSSFITCSCLFL